MLSGELVIMSLTFARMVVAVRFRNSQLLSHFGKFLMKGVIFVIRITKLEKDYLLRHGATYGKDLHTTYVGHTYVTESERNLRFLKQCNKATRK